MSLSAKLARDSLGLLIARIAAQLALVVITYLLARRLGPNGFGEYAFIATVIVIGNVFTTFGSDMFLIREIAAKEDFSKLPSVLLLQLILSLLFIGLVFSIAPYLPNQTSQSIQALRIYSFALIPLAFFTVFTSVLRGTQRMSAYAWLNVIVPVIQVAAIFVFVRRETSVITLASVLLGVQIAGAVLSAMCCASSFPLISRQRHFSFRKLHSAFSLCLPIALIAILGIAYQKLSLTMLSVLGSAALVGLFSAGGRVVEAARIGHMAVLTALYPAISKSDAHNLPHPAFKSSWSLLLAGSAVGSILLFFLAGPLVDFFFGVEYQISIPVLKILAFTLIPYTVSSFLSMALLASNREKIVLRCMLISTMLLFGLNLWLIPRAGAIGASTATLIAEIIHAALCLWVWMRDPLRGAATIRAQGASYELSDLS